MKILNAIPQTRFNQNNVVNFGAKNRVTDKMMQDEMIKQLNESYSDSRIIEKGPWGSVRQIPKENIPVPDVKLAGKVGDNKFINVWNVERTWKTPDGKEIKKPYFMAARGDMEKIENKSTGVGIIVDYTDKYGKQWTLLEEEARPIDMFLRNDKNARVIGIPLGLVGDIKPGEAASDAAIREIREETALDVKSLEPVFPWKSYVSAGFSNEGGMIYRAKIDSLKPAQIIQPDGTIKTLKATTDGGTTRAWHLVPVKNLAKFLKDITSKGIIPTGGVSNLFVAFLSKLKF